MDDYDKTPSYYKSEEMFEDYLESTSYYRRLQDSVVAVASDIDASTILDLGCGTGATTKRLATETESNVVGVDMRESVIEESNNIEDTQYVVADMTEYVEESDNIPNLTTMVYSFHHIPDPRTKKIEFLESHYNSSDSGSYLCISETFLPSTDSDRFSTLGQLQEIRSVEGYASVFWDRFEGLDEESVSDARAVGNFSREHETEAWDNAIERTDEYLIRVEWLHNVAEDIGYDVVLSEPVNALGERTVVLQK